MYEVGTKTAAPSFVVPQIAPEPAKASSAVVVYRPPVADVALRVHETVTALTKQVGELSYYNRAPEVITENWPAPLVVGGMAAFGAFFAMGEIGILSYLALGAGAVATAVMRALHPGKKRAAIAALPPLLNNEKRAALLKLADARTDFAQPQGVQVDAPIVDAALAKAAQSALEKFRNNGVHDPEIDAILARYAAMTTTIDKADEELLALVEKLTTTQHYYINNVFDGLAPDKQIALAPFLRGLLFDADGPKSVRNEYSYLMPLFRKLEAIDPVTARAVEVHPKNTPSVVPNHVDAVLTLSNVATFAAKLEGTRDTGLGWRDAQMFAIADERTGVERALMGTIAERRVEDLDTRQYFALRARAALAGLVQLRDAEPESVRAEANDLLQNVDVLFGSDSILTALNKTVAFMKLNRRVLAGGM